MLKKISFFFLFTCFLFVNIFAQDGFEYDTAGLSGGEDETVNAFLQKAVVQDNALKTQAEIFNGKRSGIYDGTTLACPYAFERDLFVGSTGEDVRLLQILLNSDKRTLIALDGPGSVGKETTSFGESTKTAVKKFQALFIEYVGVANGRFGPRTRTVMNSICNGQNQPSTSANLETRQNRNIYDNIFSVQSGAVRGGIVTTNVGGDITPPRISLSANLSSVKIGETFKVILNSSKEIVPITPDSIIVDGGSVKEIRKLSKTSYTATININEDAKKVLVQVEADKVEDLVGNKNENASNEISVKVLAAAKAPGENIAAGTENLEGGINSLLDKIISSAPTCTYSPTGLLLRVDSAGKPLNTTGCAESQQQNQNLANQTKVCPNGQTVPATQQCPEQVICNTQQTPSGTSQQCQTASQAQQQAQQQQNQQLGQLLGGLLGKGFGGGQNSSGQGNPGNNFGGGGSIPPGLQTPPGTQTTTPTPAQIAAATALCTGKTGDAKETCINEKLPQVMARPGQGNSAPGNSIDSRLETANKKLEEKNDAVTAACDSDAEGYTKTKCDAATKAAKAAQTDVDKLTKEKATIDKEAEKQFAKDLNERASKYCSDPEKKAQLATADPSTSCEEAYKNAKNIDSVKEKNTPCHEEGFKFFCPETGNCFDNKESLVMSRINDVRYVIVPNGTPNRLKALPSECIVQNPFVAKDFYVIPAKKFVGCSKTLTPTQRTAKDANFIPKSDLDNKKRGSIVSIYEYRKKIPLQGGKCVVR